MGLWGYGAMGHRLHRPEDSPSAGRMRVGSRVKILSRGTAIVQPLSQHSTDSLSTPEAFGLDPFGFQGAAEGPAFPKGLSSTHGDPYGLAVGFYWMLRTCILSRTCLV